MTEITEFSFNVGSVISLINIIRICPLCEKSIHSPANHEMYVDDDTIFTFANGDYE